MSSQMECSTELFKSFFEQMNAKVSKFARENFQLDGGLDPTGCEAYLIDALKENGLYFHFEAGDVTIETSKCIYFQNQVSSYLGDSTSNIDHSDTGGFDSAVINPCMDISTPAQEYIVLMSTSEKNIRECYWNLTDYIGHQLNAENYPDDDEAIEGLKNAEKIISNSIEGIKFEAGKAISLDEACSLLASKLSKKECELFNFKVEEYLLKSV